MKVALIQMNSGADKPANLEQARSLIEDVVRHERPDWICLPEVFDFMGGSRAQKHAAAEELPGGQAYTMMANLARHHGVFIHAGSMLEKIAGDDRLGNTTIVFDREGKERARYRKIHMFDITAPDGAQYNESAACGDAIEPHRRRILHGKRNSGLSARIFVSDDTRPCGPGYGILALWARCDALRRMLYAHQL